MFTYKDLAFKTGLLALKRSGIPPADMVIAALAFACKAKMVTDASHFDVLNVKTVWYKKTRV